MRVFLSASIPLPQRHPRFYETADVVAIREAIKGLVLVLIEAHGRLVFGGHPAVTPLIRMLFNEAGLFPGEMITLYQSDFFRKDFPVHNIAFERIVVTKGVANDRDQSLLEMRKQMLSTYFYDCGVFIGGMEGVIDEFNLFREIHPDVPAYPIPSTGAAAAILYHEHLRDFKDLEDLTYPTLFRKLLRKRD